MWIKIFSSMPFFKQYENTKYFSHEPRFNGVFLRNNLTRINDGAYENILMTKKNAKQLIGFYCFFTKYTWVLLELIIFLKNYYTSLKTNLSSTTYLE